MVMFTYVKSVALIPKALKVQLIRKLQQEKGHTSAEEKSSSMSRYGHKLLLKYNTEKRNAVQSQNKVGQ